MTPDLRYYWEGARGWCEDNKWDEDKKCCKGILLLPHTAPPSFSGIFNLYVSILLSQKMLTGYFFLVQQ